MALHSAGYMARYNKSPAKTAVGAYIELASKYELTPTQLALAWLHQRSCVTSTIIGATSAEQLKVTYTAKTGPCLCACLGCFCVQRLVLWWCYEAASGFLALFCLQENIGAFDKELPPECLTDIENLHRKFRDPAMS